MTKRRIKTTMIWIIGAILFGIILLRAMTLSMTIDEGNTYVDYARNLSQDPSFILKFPKLSNANNHLLNTLLIALVDRIAGRPYMEIIVRLPVIMFGAFFVIYVSKAYLDERLYLREYVLLLGSYYLNEYFSLARGYAMAAAFMTAALINFREYVSSDMTASKKKLWVFLTFCLLAETANTIALLPAIALYITLFIIICRRKILNNFTELKTFLILVLFAVGNILMCLWHLTVSNNDSGLFVSDLNFFNSIFYSFSKMYFDRYIAYAAAVLIIGLIVFALVKKRKDPTEIYFTLSFVIFLVITVLSCYLTGIGGPTDRTLLPELPLLVMSISETVSLIRFPVKKVFGTLFILFLSAEFLHHISFQTTTDFNFIAGIREQAYEAMRDDRKISKGMHWECAFYINQILYYYDYDISYFNE